MEARRLSLRQRHRSQNWLATKTFQPVDEQKSRCFSSVNVCANEAQWERIRVPRDGAQAQQWVGTIFPSDEAKSNPLLLPILEQVSNLREQLFLRWGRWWNSGRRFSLQ
jgi:hypothetical protein